MACYKKAAATTSVWNMIHKSSRKRISETYRECEMFLLTWRKLQPKKWFSASSVWVIRYFSSFWKIWNRYRVFSSSLLRAIIARNHLPFFKIFSILYVFAKILNILPFFLTFSPFFVLFLKNLTHALTL